MDDARAAWRHVVELFMSDEVQTRFHDATASVGLPHPGSLKALLVIDPEAPPPMRTLAERIRCDASYITGLVDTLEGLGYVERQVSPADRRVKLVSLTPEGMRARERALEVMTTPPASWERLSPNESRTLERMLGKLV